MYIVEEKTPVMGKDKSRSKRYCSEDSGSDSASENTRSSHRSRSCKRHKDNEQRKVITEEDIAFYLAKKAQKKAEKVANKLRSSSQFNNSSSGYANDSNPFGDSNLNDMFVWKKKIEHDITHNGVPLNAYSFKSEKKRQRERMAEIEKVKKRREERAIEKAQHEEELALLARERARAEFHDWEKKEEDFIFEQSKARSEIRLREGRIKPIDILIKYLDPPSNDLLDIQLREPYRVFKGLTAKEMEELRDEIKMHLDLDRAHVQYWEALVLVCEWELAEARKKEALDRARKLLVEEARGMHSSIEADVKRLLQGKSFAELEYLQASTEAKMESGDAKVVEYWEALLKHLQIFKAKAFLKDIHAKMLRTHLHGLEKPWPREREPDVKDFVPGGPEPVFKTEGIQEAGSYSPEWFHDDDDSEVEAIDPEEDRTNLERKRMAVVEERRGLEEIASKSEDSTYQKHKALKAMGAMEEGDAIFGTNNEINLDSQVYWWHDKYRPRKPKYFNRVHTGYVWHQYNQTHYDHDNPPPKFVQGYKFDIFYPDLVDKSKTPSYSFEDDGDSAETRIIKFHAGPPYEDIAFRIVKEDVEYSPKKGFKCTFERGILHMYFNFKRYRSRR